MKTPKTVENGAATAAEAKGPENSGRREFLRAFSGRLGKVAGSEEPASEPATSGRGMSRRELLSGAAGLAGAAVLSKVGAGCSNEFIDLSACEDIGVSDRCTLRRDSVRRCDVPEGTCLELDDYQFVVKKIEENGGGMDVLIDIYDKLQDCKKVNDEPLRIRESESGAVTLGMMGYNISILSVNISDSGYKTAYMMVSRDITRDVLCSGTTTSNYYVMEINGDTYYFPGRTDFGVRLEDVVIVEGGERGLFNWMDGGTPSVMFARGAGEDNFASSDELRQSYRIYVVDVFGGSSSSPASKRAIVYLSTCQD